MKNPCSAILLATLVCSNSVWAEESVLNELQLAAKLATYRETVKDFAQNLQGELMQAMKTGGPIAALEVCQMKSPEITDAASQQSGFRVARTSLKVRNPNNAPDAWEKTVLEAFAARLAAGESPKKMEHHEIVTHAGHTQLRYMKAIPTGQPCLMCHGDQEVAPDIAAKIDELYPDDQARGFKAGELRGAFTFTEDLVVK